MTAQEKIREVVLATRAVGDSARKRGVSEYAVRRAQRRCAVLMRVARMSGVKASAICCAALSAEVSS